MTKIGKFMLAVGEGIAAVFLLPMYCVSSMWWRLKYKKWVFPNVVLYARAAGDDLLTCFLSWLLWVIGGIILISLWSK